MSVKGVIQFSEEKKPFINHKELTKCAEVLRSHEGDLFVYVCLLCSRQLFEAIELELHLKDHFKNVEVFVEDIKEELGESEDFDSKEEVVGLEIFANTLPTFEESGGDNKESRTNEICDDTDDNREVLCKECSQTFKCCGQKLQHDYDIHHIRKPFVCVECRVNFHSWDALDHHTYLHTLNHLPKCIYCNQIFEFQSDLQQHLRWLFNTIMLPTTEPPAPKVKDKESFMCPKCGKSFKKLQYCRRHLQYQHGPVVYLECDLCNFKSKEKTNMIAHMRVHTKEKPYKCKVCGKGFVQSSYVKIHQRIHTGERTYQCAVCGVSFYCTNKLNTHMKKHSNTMPKFPCSLCDRVLHTPAHLKEHIRTHTGERPFNCKICKSNFRTSKGLRQHTPIHTKEKRYLCKYCGLGFAQTAGRRGHEKRVHEELTGS